MDFIADGLVWIITMCLSTQHMGCTPAQLKISQDYLQNASGTNWLTPLWDLFYMFTIGITIIYFIIELNKKYAFEGSNFTLKSFYVPFFKLIFALVLISNVGYLFSAIINLSNGFVDEIDSIFTNTEETVSVEEAVKEFVNSCSFWEKLLLFVTSLVAVIVVIVCNLIWAYKGFLFRAEFIGRLVFAPIALSDCYSGLSSAAVRYIKGTFAFLLYGVCLILLPKIISNIALSDILNQFIVSDVSGDTFDFSVYDTGIELFDKLLVCVQFIIAPIAAIGVTSAAKTITKEAMGA